MRGRNQKTVKSDMVGMSAIAIMSKDLKNTAPINDAGIKNLAY